MIREWDPFYRNVDIACAFPIHARNMPEKNAKRVKSKFSYAVTRDEWGREWTMIVIGTYKSQRWIKGGKAEDNKRINALQMSSKVQLWEKCKHSGKRNVMLHINMYVYK